MSGEMRLVMTAVLALCAAPAWSESASVQPCGPDLPGHARSIAEPWEDNTMTFANGAVRVAILDTIEPAAGAFHLLVLSPPYDELGDRQCRIVSYGGDWLGFGGLSLERVEASYDPATGLRIVMDMGRYVPETGLNDVLALAVTINQSTGAVTGAW
jgi:hypothetical protein